MKNNKRKMLLLSLVIVLVLGVGATVAYIHMSTQSITNEFEATQVSCQVVEKYDDVTKTKSEVQIYNSSDIDAFIRAEVVINWVDAAGNIYGGSEPKENTDYIISFNTADWFERNDGFYYYKSAVESGKNTNDLIISCRDISVDPPEGYYLSVEIIASAIQADGESFGAPTGTAGQQPAEIAWTNDKVEIIVNDAATTLTVRNK